MRKKIGIFWPTKGREILSKKKRNLLEPEDFLYGFKNYYKKNYNKIELISLDSRKKSDTFIAKFEEYFTRFKNRFSNFKFFYYIIKGQKKYFLNQDLIISFTDSGSLSLGVFGRKNTKKPILIGGFHALADILNEVNPILRFIYKIKINKSLQQLDHLFFFGEQDRKESIRIFDIEEKKTSVFKFGVDTNFWFPSKKSKIDKKILSVGSDPKRDYSTLLNAPQTYPTEIITNLKINIPKDSKHIKVLKGSYFKKALSNIDLRKLYQDASIIVIPIRDVFQPSGYSVTLQAMSCGKPVILPKFKGLWDRSIFINKKNCIFYKPENSNDLGSKINFLMENKTLLKTLRLNSRKTALKHFSLSRMNCDLEKMLDSFISKTKN